MLAFAPSDLQGKDSACKRLLTTLYAPQRLCFPGKHRLGSSWSVQRCGVVTMPGATACPTPCMLLQAALWQQAEHNYPEWKAGRQARRSAALLNRDSQAQSRAATTQLIRQVIRGDRHKCFVVLHFPRPLSPRSLSRRIASSAPLPRQSFTICSTSRPQRPSPLPCLIVPSPNLPLQWRPLSWLPQCLQQRLHCWHSSGLTT